MSGAYALAVGILAVWRVTHLLALEDGPWNAAAHLRRRVRTGFWGGLVGCFYCLSVWTAAPAAAVLAPDWLQGLLLWPALSGGAILLQRITAPPPPASYYEEPEEAP